MKKIIQLQGLDCAVCASELEREIAKIDGVKSATITFVNQKLVVEYKDEKTLKKILQTANNFEEVQVVEGIAEQTSHKKEWIMIAVSAVFFILGVLANSFDSAYGIIMGGVLYALAYITVGLPVLKSTAKNLVKGKIFDENFLMTLASIGAMCIGEMSEAVLVIFLYQLGETLQGMAVGSSRRSISSLMELKSEYANLLVDGEQKIVPPMQLQIGDRIVVKAGERVPVDGILLGENALLDTKSLTGESEYANVKNGEEILAGCINVGGMYEMKVVRRYENSAVSKILELVENASSGKAEPEKFITKFAKYYTPIVCILALCIGVVLPLILGVVAGNLQWSVFARWLKSALTFLVISCPCALVISVPLTYFSGIGACAKRGILVKGATYLDVLAKADIVAFDKTGTLTEGNFAVCEILPEDGVDKEELLSVATAVEKGSSHPIAKAFSVYSTNLLATNVQEQAGYGLKAEINGEKALVGTGKLLKENGLAVADSQGVYTLVHVAKGDRYLGCIQLGDKLRLESKETIIELKKSGVKRVAMLTGDNEERAYKIANEAGVYEVYGKLLPDEKLQKAEELKKDGTLVYVGDGINDAPVMTVSDCAVSMGSLGSAAAVEASDMVLISDNLKALPKAIRLAKKTKSIVFTNIIFSIAMKVLFMILGLFGVVELWLAVFADVGVMLIAVLNSFRVK